MKLIAWLMSWQKNAKKIVTWFLAYFFYNVYFYVGVFYSVLFFMKKNVVFWKNGLQFDTLIMACSSFFSLLTICKLIYPDGCLNRFEQCLSFIPVGIGFIYFLYEGLQFNMSIWVDCLQMNHYQCLIDMLKISLFPSLISMGLLAAGFPTQYQCSGLQVSLFGASFSYVLLRLIEAPLNSIQLFIWHYIPVIFILFAGSLFVRIFKCFFRLKRIAI